MCDNREGYKSDTLTVTCMLHVTIVLYQRGKICDIRTNKQGDSNSEVIICFALNFEIYNGFGIYLTSLS